MKRVILVHGFNVRDGGAGSILKLTPYLEAAGYRVKRFRLGFLDLIGVRMLNGRFSDLLTDMSEPGDIVIGHSNGCLISMLAAEQGAEFAQMIFINPALDGDTPLPKQIKRLDVWFSPSDGPTWWAKFLYKHRWGDMARTGYVGVKDSRVVNHNKQNQTELSSSHHSDVFEDKKLAFYAPLIIQNILP